MIVLVVNAFPQWRVCFCKKIPDVHNMCTNTIQSDNSICWLYLVTPPTIVVPVPIGTTAFYDFSPFYHPMTKMDRKLVTIIFLLANFRWSRIFHRLALVDIDFVFRSFFRLTKLKSHCVLKMSSFTANQQKKRSIF